MNKYPNRDKFIKEHREKGLCIECNNPISKKSKCRCDKCLERRRKYKKRKRDEAKNKGLCIECLKYPIIPNITLCETCYYKKVSNRHFNTQKHWKK
jgi:hypothetical protein